MPRRSLRRAARKELRARERATRSQGVARRTRSIERPLRFVSDATGSLIAVSAIALLGLLPLKVSLPVDNPGDFIGTLWQVQSATVALTITIVLFVFQIFSSRSESSVHDFAEETSLYPIFFVGLWAIALDGLALLSPGYLEGPDGWPGVWATVWAGASLFLVGLLFIRALRTIDVSALEALRIKRARKQLEHVIDRVVMERFALELLTEECTTAAIDLAHFSPDPSGRAVLQSPTTGRVADLNLRTLRRVGRSARELWLPRPALSVHLGTQIASGNAWLTTHKLLPSLHPRLTHALRVSEDDLNARLMQTLNELHVEALRAITAPSPPRYAQIVETYSELILALPETWARYGFVLESDVGAASGLFEWTFLDIIRSNLYEELLHTLEGHDRDLVQEVVNLPIDVSIRALDVNARALIASMMAMLRSYYSAILRSDHPHREMLSGWTLTRLREYADFYLESRITGD